eukprot:Em0023g893a
MADDRGEETVIQMRQFPPIPIAHQDVSRAGVVQCEVIPNLYLDTKMCVAAKVYKSVTQTVVACNHISTPSASDCMMSQGVQSSIQTYLIPATILLQFAAHSDQGGAQPVQKE